MAVTGLFVESPWWGILELVDEPNFVNVECWNGEYYALYVAETLRPLTPEAALMLDRNFGDPVWSSVMKRAWELEPVGLL